MSTPFPVLDEPQDRWGGSFWQHRIVEGSWSELDEVLEIAGVVLKDLRRQLKRTSGLPSPGDQYPLAGLGLPVVYGKKSSVNLVKLHNNRTATSPDWAEQDYQQLRRPSMVWLRPHPHPTGEWTLAALSFLAEVKPSAAEVRVIRHSTARHPSLGVDEATVHDRLRTLRLA